MGALVDHLIEGIHQVIPVGLINIANHAYYIPKAPQFPGRITYYNLGQIINGRLGNRRSAYRQIVPGKYVFNPGLLFLAHHIVIGKVTQLLIEFLFK